MEKKQKKQKKARPEPVLRAELPPEEPLAEEESNLPPEIEQMDKEEEPEYEPDFIPED